MIKLSWVNGFHTLYLTYVYTLLKYLKYLT